MQITHDWARQRTAHKSACWECYRCHRACDGARPCKRCLAFGQGFLCRDPSPNERLPRKRKKANSSEEEHPEDISQKMPKYLGVFILDPPTLYRSPSSLPEEAEASTTPASSPSTSSSSTTNAFDKFPYPAHTNENICKLNKFSRSTPQTVFQSEPTGEHQLMQHPTPYQFLRTPPRHMAKRTDAFPLSLADLMAEFSVETEESSDHIKTTSSVFQSLTIPDDLMRLTESLFTPFGLRDSTQV